MVITKQTTFLRFLADCMPFDRILQLPLFGNPIHPHWQATASTPCLAPPRRLTWHFKPVAFQISALRDYDGNLPRTNLYRNAKVFLEISSGVGRNQRIRRG